MLFRFEILKLLGFLVSFYLSGKTKKIILELKGLPTEGTGATLVSRVYTGILFYIFGHLIGMKLIFDSSFYVRLRLAYEAQINYNRNEIKNLMDEYPFRHKTDFLYSDLEVRNRLTHFDGKYDRRDKKELKTPEEIEAYVKKKNAKYIITREKD